MVRRFWTVVLVGWFFAVGANAAELAMPPSAGVYGGSEIMFFKPFAEAGSVPNEILMATGADDFLPAWRLWGGFVDEEGVGSRIRWWQYDQGSMNTDGLESRLVFQKLDWEATQQFSFNRWQATCSGGLTYVGNQLGETDTTSPSPSVFFPLRYRFDGVGITLGLQATRTGARYPSLAFATGIQWSGVYGNGVGTQWGLISEDATSRSLQGVTGSILELAIGPRWERLFGNGMIAFIGGNAEAQFWMTGLGATSYSSLIQTYVRSGDVGLVGLTLNVGFRR